MCCLMKCYFIHLCLLDSFHSYYFSSQKMCDRTRDPVNGIIASLLVINFHYLLRFIDAMIFICVVIIPIDNIVKLISA